MSKNFTKEVQTFSPSHKFKKKVRTKRIYSHPNPLFEKWLKEWKSEAETRGSNMKYNYQKAIKSLQKYPLPLHSGKECLVLASFGNKICSLIDKKLEEYIEENGPINWDDHIKVNDIRKPTKAKRRKSINNYHKNKNSAPREENSIAKVGKEYTPAFRSGGYALLLTLYKKSIGKDFEGFMKKDELMQEAQDLCESSFTVPPEGSHYTAWSSMSTLIKKNFVERNGNPSRYSLTVDGEVLASKLVASNTLPTPPSSISSTEERKLCRIIDSESVTNSDSSDFHIRSSYTHNISDSNETEDDEVSIIDDKQTDSGSSLDNEKQSERFSNSIFASSVITCINLNFVYVTKEGLDTPSKSEAFFMVDEDKGSLLFLIKAKLINLLSSDFDYQLDDNRDAPPGYTYAYLPDDAAPSFSTELPQNKIQDTPHGQSGKPSASCDSDDSSEETYSGLLGRIRLKSGEGVRDIGKGSRSSTENSKDSNLEKEALKTSKRKLVQEKKNTLKIQDVSNNIEKPKRKRRIETDDINYIPKQSSTSITSPSTSDHSRVNKIPNTSSEIVVALKKTSESDILFTLRPNSYKIILNIDNTEVYGGSTEGNKKSKEIIKEDLQRNKIDFRVRNLNVGDFLWTCQGCDSSGQDREVVLPFVVERKRMDDLGQSIRDGRFKEQKFRLKQTGLRHLIYLVEEYGSNHSIVPIPTCEQAITNTQVIDNFTIKMTKDQRESAAYLTIMTRYLQAKFKNKTLHCVNRESSELLSRNPSSSSELFLMSFNDLNSSSVKNRSLTIREMFAKHLLQINGASVDKVASIIQKYPTPRALMQGLEAQCPSLVESLLSAIKCQKSGRMMDQTVSSHIARIYTWENLF